MKSYMYHKLLQKIFTCLKGQTTQAYKIVKPTVLVKITHAYLAAPLAYTGLTSFIRATDLKVASI